MTSKRESDAHNRVFFAIWKGWLVVGDCAEQDESCRGRIEGHHEDYDKPLDVVWLCKSHHRRLHNELRRDLAA